MKRGQLASIKAAAVRLSRTAPDGSIQCVKCKEFKQPSEFYIRKENGRPMTDCKACHTTASVERARRNPILSRQRALRHHYRHPWKIPLWKKNNPEKAKKWDREHPALVTAMKRKSRIKMEQLNPGYGAAKAAARRATVFMATPPWADFERMEAVYREARRSKMEVDHIVPLKGKSVCGLHVTANLQIVTTAVNRRKSNKFTSGLLCS